MKLKHGTKVVVYACPDYSIYKGMDNYLHPTITVQRAVICDALEDFKEYGNSFMEKAKLLREHTGSTLYVDHRGGFGQEATFRWQTNREYENGVGYYPALYACKLESCGFDLDTLALVTKLAKLTPTDWSTTPLQLVDALSKIGAVRTVYNKAIDCHIVADHLNDDMFGLPLSMRKQESRVS